VVYLAARELVPDRRDVLHTLPLLVALLTAVSYWHLNWSRVGLRVILVPLIASLLFTFLWRGFRRHRPLDFAVAGLLLGLGFYSYQAARLLPVLVAVAFALDALSRRAWTRQDSARVLLVTALALSVYMPLGLYARANPGVLTARIDQAVVLDATQPISPQLSTLTAQAGTALAMYGLRGDSDPLFTIPGRPSLNPFMFAFLLVGIGIAVWRWRKPTYLFLLAWLAVMTAPAMIADLAATAKRALGAFPAAMILIALGLLAPCAWLRARENRLPARLYAVLLVAGLAFTTLTTYRDYFIVWAADPDLPNHFQADHAAIGAAIGARPPEERVYLSPYPPDQPVIQLHSELRPGVRGYNGRFCLPFPDPATATPAATYVIVPGLGDQSLRWLQEMYPSGNTSDSALRPNSDRPMFQTFSLPAGATPTTGPSAPSDAAWANGIALTGYTVSNPAPQPGETVTVDLFYRTRSGLPDLTAFVHLLGPPHPATGSPLWAQSDSAPCQGALPTGRWADGDILRDQIALVIAPDTPPGDYQLMTGFYSWPELERVPLAGSDETATPLATITVRAAE
jgi:hypothetical protein